METLKIRVISAAAKLAILAYAEEWLAHDLAKSGGISREQARILGLETYTPVEPCKHGHNSKRSTRYGYCLECNLEAQRRQRETFAPAQTPGDQAINPLIPMTRSRARALGLKRFMPVEPCKHGHVSLRSTQYGYCLACNSAAQRRRNKKPAG